MTVGDRIAVVMDADDWQRYVAWTRTERLPRSVETWLRFLRAESARRKEKR